VPFVRRSEVRRRRGRIRALGHRFGPFATNGKRNVKAIGQTNVRFRLQIALDNILVQDRERIGKRRRVRSERRKAIPAKQMAPQANKVKLVGSGVGTT
jgi:hypothetical protein